MRLPTLPVAAHTVKGSPKFHLCFLCGSVIFLFSNQMEMPVNCSEAHPLPVLAELFPELFGSALAIVLNDILQEPISLAAVRTAYLAMPIFHLHQLFFVPCHCLHFCGSLVWQYMVGQYFMAIGRSLMWRNAVPCQSGDVSSHCAFSFTMSRNSDEAAGKSGMSSVVNVRTMPSPSVKLFSCVQ